MIWSVPGTVVRVVDGHTVVVDADLGWHVRLRIHVRVAGIDAPGVAAKKFAQTLLAPGTLVTVESKRVLGSSERYPRSLANLLYAPSQVLPTEHGSFVSAMLAHGHATLWPAS